MVKKQYNDDLGDGTSAQTKMYIWMSVAIVIVLILVILFFVLKGIFYNKGKTGPQFDDQKITENTVMANIYYMSDRIGGDSSDMKLVLSSKEIKPPKNLKPFKEFGNCSDYSEKPDWNKYAKSIKQIEIQEKIKPKKFTYFFSGMNVKELDFAKIDISDATDFSFCFAFTRGLDLNNIKNWDMSKTTNIAAMFGDTEITDLTPIANWNVGNVKDFSGTFSQDRELLSLDPLKNWDVKNGVRLHNMFNSCVKIKDVNALANWNVANAELVSSMFFNCSSLQDTTGIQNWNTSNFSAVDFMFAYTPVQQLDLRNWDGRKIASAKGMFANCVNLKRVLVGPYWPLYGKTCTDLLLNAPIKTVTKIINGVPYQERPVNLAEYEEVEAYDRMIEKREEAIKTGKEATLNPLEEYLSLKNVKQSGETELIKITGNEPIDMSKSKINEVQGQSTQPLLTEGTTNTGAVAGTTTGTTQVGGQTTGVQAGTQTGTQTGNVGTTQTQQQQTQQQQTQQTQSQAQQTQPTQPTQQTQQQPQSQAGQPVASSSGLALPGL